MQQIVKNEALKTSMQRKEKIMKVQNWELLVYLQEGSTLRTSFVHVDDEEGSNTIEREFELLPQTMEIESFGSDYDSPNYEVVTIEPTDSDYDLDSELDIIIDHINKEMEANNAA